MISPIRPDLWFSIRVMKGIKVTDIPLVKTWVHSFVMNIFQSCEYNTCVHNNNY